MPTRANQHKFTNPNKKPKPKMMKDMTHAKMFNTPAVKMLATANRKPMAGANVKSQPPGMLYMMDEKKHMRKPSHGIIGIIMSQIAMYGQM